MLRVQIRVDRKLLERVLRKLTVRPFVLCKLLHYLVDHNHSAFRGTGSPESIKQRLVDAVERWYPCEANQENMSVEERVCDVAPHIAQELSTTPSEHEAQKTSSKQPKQCSRTRMLFLEMAGKT